MQPFVLSGLEEISGKALLSAVKEQGEAGDMVGVGEAEDDKACPEIDNHFQ